MHNIPISTRKSQFGYFENKFYVRNFESKSKCHTQYAQTIVPYVCTYLFKGLEYAYGFVKYTHHIHNTT